MSKELALLEKFRRACDEPGAGSASRILALSPFMAQFHVKNEDGRFVTALDIAMTAGRPDLVATLLENGARMDLPVGAPPSMTTTGHTSMTKALSRKFAETPNYLRIVDSMIAHHGLREMEMEKTPVLSALKAAADKIMERTATALRDAMAGQSVPLLSAMIPASMLGVTTGAVMQDLLSRPAQGALMLGALATTAGVVALHRYAVGDLESDRLRMRQQQAVDVFDSQAGLAPMGRERRLPPLTDNVLEEDTTMSMGR